MYPSQFIYASWQYAEGKCALQPTITPHPLFQHAAFTPSADHWVVPPYSQGRYTGLKKATYIGGSEGRRQYANNIPKYKPKAAAACDEYGSLCSLIVLITSCAGTGLSAGPDGGAVRE